MNKKNKSHLGILKLNGVHLLEHEYSTISALLEDGHHIELIPPSNIKGIHLPDIIIDGIPWEIKAPEGSSRKTIKHNMQNALHQSQNIILDLRRCNLDIQKAIREAEREFSLSKRAYRMKIIIHNINAKNKKDLTGSDKEYIILDYKK